MALTTIQYMKWRATKLVTARLPEDYYSDMTHLYTPEGTRILTSAVLRSLCSALALDPVGFTLSDYQAIKGVLGL